MKTQVFTSNPNFCTLVQQALRQISTNAVVSIMPTPTSQKLFQERKVIAEAKKAPSMPWAHGRREQGYYTNHWRVRGREKQSYLLWSGLSILWQWLLLLWLLMWQHGLGLLWLGDGLTVCHSLGTGSILAPSLNQRLGIVPCLPTPECYCAFVA